ITTSEPYTTDVTSPTIHVRYPSFSRISAALNSSDSFSCSISQSIGKSITVVRGGHEGEGDGGDVMVNVRMHVKVEDKRWSARRGLGALAACGRAPSMTNMLQLVYRLLPR